MNKTNTAETTLKSIKSMCAERDRKERERLRANRLDIERREEAEKARVQNTNSILQRLWLRERTNYGRGCPFSLFYSVAKMTIRESERMVNRTEKNVLYRTAR